MSATGHDGTATPLYFVGPIVDSLVIGVGSIVLYLVLRSVPEWGNSIRIASVGAWLVWTVNYPHFASTNFRLYHSSTNIAQYPMTAWLVPAMVGAAMVGSFCSPLVIAPAFVMLYQLWSPYHFSGQTLGVTMVYARRSGTTINGWLRRSLTGFVFGTFVLQAARFESTTTDARFYGVTYPSLGLPGWVVDTAVAWLWCTGLLVIGLLAVQVVRTGRWIPPIVLLPAAAQFVWFAATPVGQFVYLVPFFHSLQYLLIGWNVQLKERHDLSGAPPSMRFVTSETARWMGINVAIGYAMFWALPRVGAQFGRPAAFSTAVVLAGLQLHHFFVDGVIWRLRNASVRGVLTSSVPILSGRRAVAATASAPVPQ
jgi:hypothetical protein